MKSTYDTALDLSERPDKTHAIAAFIRWTLNAKFGSKEFRRYQGVFNRGRAAVERELGPILRDEDENAA